MPIQPLKLLSHPINNRIQSQRKRRSLYQHLLPLNRPKTTKIKITAVELHITEMEYVLIMNTMETEMEMYMYISKMGSTGSIHHCISLLIRME